MKHLFTKPKFIAHIFLMLCMFKYKVEVRPVGYGKASVVEFPIFSKSKGHVTSVKFQITSRQCLSPVSSGFEVGNKGVARVGGGVVIYVRQTNSDVENSLAWNSQPDDGAHFRVLNDTRCCFAISGFGCDDLFVRIPVATLIPDYITLTMMMFPNLRTEVTIKGSLRHRYLRNIPASIIVHPESHRSGSLVELNKYLERVVQVTKFIDPKNLVVVDRLVQAHQNYFQLQYRSCVVLSQKRQGVSPLGLRHQREALAMTQQQYSVLIQSLDRALPQFRKLSTKLSMRRSRSRSWVSKLARSDQE